MFAIGKYPVINTFPLALRDLGGREAKEVTEMFSSRLLSC